MFLNNFIYMFLFMLSCLMFTFFYKHILLTLICMEFMMINLFLNIYMLLINLNMNIYFISFFLNISICEGILGLSILVYFIRNSGNDYLSSLSLLKW